MISSDPPGISFSNHSSTKRYLPLAGYADKLSARPGDSVAVKVSSLLEEPYHASLVRVRYADPNPEGPGVQTEEIRVDWEGQFPSREQKFYPGSYGRVDSAGSLSKLASFTVLITLWPTLPGSSEQTLISHQHAASGWRLFLNKQGCLTVELGNGEHVKSFSLDGPLRERKWYRAWVGFDSETSGLTLGKSILDPGLNREDQSQSSKDFAFKNVSHEIPLMIGARYGDPVHSHFNGKLEAPTIFSRALNEEEVRACFEGKLSDGLAAHWDFSKEVPTSRILDNGPENLEGRLINCPARGMTGSSWEGKEMCWRHAPEDYRAIHFHEDDIYDFGWETDFHFQISQELKTGIYAIKLECGEHQDFVPLFVLPPKGSRKADLCVLVSTFTYTIYGNHARPDFNDSWRERIRDWGAYPYNPADFRTYGLSTYNFHSDGSGICIASHLRPLMNLRPGYLTFGEGNGSGLRHYQADSHLYAWLEAKGLDFDLITDQELHEEGVDSIKDYKALCTGSHPEYHTPQTLNALQNYRDQGGNLIYLGGNGFYWKIALSPENPSLLEIRRGESGIRAWAAEPGEYYHAFNGSYGGLWRRNGRPPQMLAGVGFSAQGKFEGSYYRRTEESRNPELGWMFQGLEDEEILGDFGFSGGGAAGFELDRADIRLGSPENIQIIGRSENHSSSFVLVPEEMLTHITNWPGEEEQQKLIRADLVYFKTPSGGEVFSTGSITFCGSLPWNDFDNNISRLLENVMKRFLR